MAADARARIVVVIELAAIVGAVVLGGRWGVIALLALVSITLALRGRGWLAPEDHDRGAACVAGGALVGALALAAALALSPALFDATGFPIAWSTVPVVRGSWPQLLVAALPTLAIAVAGELVFRRWLLERVAAVVRAAGEPAIAASAAGVIVAALVEAAVLPVGDAGGWGRLGTALASGGLGILYVSAAGRIAASIGARVTFELGALIVQALRLVD